MRGIFSVSEPNGLGKISEGYTLFFMYQQFYHIDRFWPLSLEALCLHLPHVLLYRPTSLPGWKGPRSDWNFNGLSTQSRPDWSCYRKSCPTADPPTYQSGPLSSFTGRTRSRRLESLQGESYTLPRKSTHRLRLYAEYSCSSCILISRQWKFTNLTRTGHTTLSNIVVMLPTSWKPKNLEFLTTSLGKVFPP